MIPLQGKLSAALEAQRQAFTIATDALIELDQRIQKTLVGDVTPLEAGYHEAWLRQVTALLEELQQRFSIVQRYSQQRLIALAVGQEAYEIEVPELKQKFTLDADLLPSPPARGTPEYQALVAWLKERVAGVVVEDLKWSPLKTLCEELTARGEPLPPGVKVSPKMKVKVTPLSES